MVLGRAIGQGFIPALLLVLANACPAHAEPGDVMTPSTIYPARFCPRDAARLQALALVPRRNRPADSAATAYYPAMAERNYARFRSMDFRGGLIDRLAGARRVSFLSLVKTSGTDVFFGVTRAGVLGLHVDLRNALLTRPDWSERHAPGDDPAAVTHR